MKPRKLLLAAVAAGMLLSGAAGVYAGTKLEKISAYLNHDIRFELNGETYVPVDGHGEELTPITYNNMTYLPIRATAEALDVPVTYDEETDMVVIGINSAQGGGEQSNEPSGTLTDVSYTTAQRQLMEEAFSQFDGFEAPYAPGRMLAGDAFRQAAAGADGVTLRFDRMQLYISPRDSSYLYEGEAVELSSGTTGKWITDPDLGSVLSFQVDDRYVMLRSEDGSLSRGQLEQIASSVTRLGTQ